MSNLINQIRKGEKIVLWIGDSILKLAGLPSKKELAKNIYSDVRETAKVGIGNNKSLSEVSQVYLDSVTGSKKSLLKKIRNHFAHDELLLNPLHLLIEAPFVESIVTTSIDTIIEKCHESDITCLNYYNEEFQGSGEKKLYRVNGSIDDMSKTIITKQDYRKLHTVALYNDFFQKLSKELSEKTILFIGYDLDDPDTIESISMIFNKVNKEGAKAYFITSSSIINANAVTWLNANDIKILKESDSEFIKLIEEYMSEAGLVQKSTKDMREVLEKKRISL